MNNIELEYNDDQIEQINRENDIYIFIGVSTILCFCNIFLATIMKKYKNNILKKKLLLPIHIRDIKENDCSICLEEYVKKCNIIELNCGHQYHKNCIQEWFIINNNCPKCRKIII